MRCICCPFLSLNPMLVDITHSNRREVRKTLSALQLSFPSVCFCITSDQFFSPPLLLVFRICCDIRDTCFDWRSEHLKSSRPRFHIGFFFFFSKKDPLLSIITQKSQKEGHTRMTWKHGRNKKEKSHYLNRKGESQASTWDFLIHGQVTFL